MVVDADADLALIKVKPKGLSLRPLPLGSDSGLRVGDPVAAIGSPFGEPQSLSVGVISALDRTIESLTDFSIPGAIQTDAAINRGNSGGPLVDAGRRVIGINARIETTGGGGEGVGFAIPIDAAKRSFKELRDHGDVDYAYLGITTVPVFPQLARKFDLGTDQGAWIQRVNAGSPASDAGLRAGDRTEEFQFQDYRVGGDVIVELDGKPIRAESDVGRIVFGKRPGDEVNAVVIRDGEKQTVKIKLGERPD